MYRQILQSNQVANVLMQSTRSVTDIAYYKLVEYSHLHEVDSQSSKRKFLLKLDKIEREKVAAENSRNASKTAVKLNPNDLDPIKVPTYIERGPSDILRYVRKIAAASFHWKFALKQTRRLPSNISKANIFNVCQVFRFLS